MMQEKMYEAIGDIREEYIRAAHADIPKKLPARLRYGALAACLALLISIPVILRVAKLNKLPEYTDTGDTSDYSDTVAAPGGTDSVNPVTPADRTHLYRDVELLSANLEVAWRWEYLTVYERYPSIEIDGVPFIRLGEEIRESAVGDRVGSYEAVGWNFPYETPEGGYRAVFDAYAIGDIPPQYMLALRMEDRYYCYISDVARAELRTAAWGEVLTRYGLSDAIEFHTFSYYENGRGKDWFSLADGAYIWEVLTSLPDAPAAAVTDWKKDGDFYSFTVTSDVFGIYKKTLYITENGYLWTNMLDVECLYRIGEEASEKIIAYIREHSTKTTQETYRKTVVGTVTEITAEHILLDDSVLCKDAADGITFRVLLQDKRIRRHVEDNRIKVGDLVEIVYKDSIDIADGYVIDSAIGAALVILRDSTPVTPE